MSDGRLNGIRVLVVEDDYYLATDTERMLVYAGALVRGPFGDEESAMAMADHSAIDCAILDVNFGPGPSFTLARTIRAQGIPFLFVTGYDRDALPEEFADVQRLQKPYVERDLLRALAHLFQDRNTASHTDSC